ncbi:MAG: hypothetical protein NUV72_08405, partial [Bauldia sp.]|nr:hypothetical protein [Bauldia sp.]
MRPRTILAALIALSCLPAPAFAEAEAEAFLKSWVASIDETPGWRASYSGLSSDPAGGRTTLYGLDVRSKQPGFSVHFDSVAVTGFIPSTDGTLAATEVAFDGGEIGVGFVAVGITNARFKDFSLPSAESFAWSDTRPFVAMVKAVAPLAKVRMSSGRIGSVVLMEEIDGVRSRISYNQIAIDNWADGKIASIKAGPLKTESPAEEPLTAIAVAGVEAHDIDLDAMLALYDPDRYVGGVGDKVWHTAVGSATYRDMIAAVPGASVRIGEASLEDFRVRQPKAGIEALFDIGMSQVSDPSADPTDALKALELLTAYGVGKFELRDLDVRGTGIERVRMGKFSLTDFSSDRIGEFAIEGVEGAISGQGTVTLGRVAVGDLVPPPLEAVIAAAKADAAGGDVDVSSVLPTIGFVEVAGIDVALGAAPRTRLARFRVDLDNYVGPVPTSVTLGLADADVAVALIEDAKTRRMLADLGYDRVRIDAALNMDWSEAGDIAVKEFRLAMRDVGSLSGDITLTGIRPSEIDNLQQDAALEKLSLVRGSLTVTDDSIVGRGLAVQARQLKADPDKFRQQFVMGLPFMLTFLGDMDLQKQLAPVLQTFIRTTGGSITALAGPVQPVPLTLIAAAGGSAPFALLKMLSVSFSGVAGTEPAAAPMAPVPEPAGT